MIDVDFGWRFAQALAGADELWIELALRGSCGLESFHAATKMNLVDGVVAPLGRVLWPENAYLAKAVHAAAALAVQAI